MFNKIAVMGLVTYSALAGQEINNHPRVIADANVAACISRIGMNMVENGVAQLPVTMKLEVSSVAASHRPAKPIGDPITAACVDLLAQNLVRNGAAVPFAIKVTPAR